MICDMKELDKVSYELFKKLFAKITDGIEIPIKSTQLYMLYFIRTKGECMVTDIAGYLEVTMGAVTSLVDRLIEFDLVERSRSKTDRRQVIITLSKSGDDLLKKIDKNREKIIEDYFGDMDQSEIEYFSNMMKKIITKILYT